MGVFQEAMEREMSLRGFAPRTQDVYVRWMRRLVRFGRVPADSLTEAEVRGFLAELTQKRRLLRIPEHREHRFRPIVNGDSGIVNIDSGHPER